MNYMAIRARLMEKGSGQVRSIKGSVDFASALRDGVKLTPAQFVVAGSYRDSDNPFGTEMVAQERMFDFSVITVMSNLRDARGEAAQDEMNELLDPTRKALVGWVPGEGFDPIEANGGQVFEFKDGQLWWQDRFRSRCENRTTN
jgi:hypothetical protein